MTITKVSEKDIVKDAEFKTSIGTIKIVDRMPGHYKSIGLEEDGVKTMMLSEGMILDAFGTGGYVDTVSEIVEFINENL